ncbi:interleukin 6 signal transducer [Rhinolophus ferrumequinum]|uniref:Interleukin 6 cytokine family signal transducer n=1 Tax=Rhinolophus ferrumequinum TaxID=59479 RepID=A0A671F4T4_RHIFE|nr:interleukin 6 signal transducer [Rhinolophus ferrumequinum]
MLTLQTWTVQALFIFLSTESLGELLDPCGYINPESPVVQLGSNFTAVCVLKEKLKPFPPHNLSVSNSEELSSILKLTWINSSIKSFMKLKYDIQYRTKDASTWSQIPPEDTASTRSSFTVQDLKPFTEYVFRIRCMKEDGKGFWSDWSAEESGITYEDKLKNTSGLMFQILQRVILPSGHLTHLLGIILIQKIKCIQMAISLT